MSDQDDSIAAAVARLEANSDKANDRAGEVYCDRCGAVRFVPTLAGLTHAHCPRVVQGTWRAVPSAQN